MTSGDQPRSDRNHPPDAQSSSPPGDRTKVNERHDPSTRQPKGLRHWLWLAARIALVGLLVTWFVTSRDLGGFVTAFYSIPAWAFLLAFILGGMINSIGGVRWRVLMASFGAKDLPSVLSTIRLFFVGLFYNTYVPGSIGGDLVRGVVTRRYFEKAAASYVVILLERTIGFMAMIMVFLFGVSIGPEIVDLEEHLPWVIVIFGLSLVVVVIALASGRLSQSIRRLPPLERPSGLLWVLILSLASHFCGVTQMFCLVQGAGLTISYATIVIVMPVAFTAAVIPLNVLGVGTREVTLVALFGLIGVSTEQAAALSLGYALVHLGLALMGGILQLVTNRPL